MFLISAIPTPWLSSHPPASGIHHDTLNVRKGDRVELTCKPGQGSGAISEYQFFRYPKDGSTQWFGASKNGSLYIIPYISDLHSGKYVCKVKIGTGQSDESNISNPIFIDNGEYMVEFDIAVKVSISIMRLNAMNIGSMIC